MRGAMFLLVLGLSLAIAAPARASSGHMTGFWAVYAAPGGAERVHHGVDAAWPAGSAVPAPCEGIVTFAGRTPGIGGGSMMAVTIETAQGLLSVMPLSELAVRQGDAVAAGSGLGTLSASGDASSAEPHVHLGLRRDGVYVDPTALIGGLRLPSPPDLPAEKSAPSQGAAVPVAAVAMASPVAAAAPQAPREEARAAAKPVPVSEPCAGDLSLPVETRLTADEAGARADGAKPRVAGVPQPQPTLAPQAVTSAVPARLSWPAHLRGEVPALACAFLSLAALGGLLACRATALSRISQGYVSDRLGTLLQHLKAGDTLRGLTSCSGPTAFTVPGPLAQRR
jgi:murein DD-endopeptidase MepM/ murein hydrolase activator NlpD